MAEKCFSTTFAFQQFFAAYWVLTERMHEQLQENKSTSAMIQYLPIRHWHFTYVKCNSNRDVNPHLVTFSSPIIQDLCFLAHLQDLGAAGTKPQFRLERTDSPLNHVTHRTPPRTADLQNELWRSQVTSGISRWTGFLLGQHLKDLLWWEKEV